MYYTLNDYLRKTFGCKVYKLSISGGMTCPNRDGAKSFGGCIFCSSSGSGEFAEAYCENINLQIEKAKKTVKNKITDGKYIAYFQDHTNTYAKIDHLKKIFTEAIGHPDIVALSVATRPDCLPLEVLELLEELNRIKPVWIELGLQTIHKKTADLINRQYELNEFEQAVKSLKSRNISVIVHMIIGLPNETEQMMYESAQYIGNSGVDGIKFHMLHILKNTKLHCMYEKDKFPLLSLEQYTEILITCLKLIPPNLVIHRITGDGAKKDLIAPLWTADKKNVLNYINAEIKRQNVTQGQLFKTKTEI